MAEYSGGGLDADYGDSSGLGGGGGLSSDEEYETMTAAEVLEKLEEVYARLSMSTKVHHCTDMCMWITLTLAMSL